MELRLAVISDLHCQHSSRGYADSLLITDMPRYPGAHHPVSALLDLISKQNLRADVVVMPGDLTNKVDPQGMMSGWAFVQEIVAAFGAQLLAPTLGNHDVVSREPCDDSFHLAKTLHPPFPYRQGPLFNQFWARGFCFLDETNARLLLINSVASHTNEESAKRGLITEHQLEEIEKALSAAAPKTFQVAVCHHHPLLHEDIGLGASDVMVNGSLLTALLARHGFHLLIHGHKHHPKLSYAPGATPLPILASGSFSAGMKNGLASRTRNVFHLIALETHGSPHTSVRGKITTWQFQHARGWTPASHNAVDFPHHTGFGCFAPPAEIASVVEGAFRKLGVSVADWGSLFPESEMLQFVPPSTFEAVGGLLDSRGLRLFPPAPDVPSHIGVVT